MAYQKEADFALFDFGNISIGLKKFCNFAAG
jgi:hypothetical protein